MREGNRQDAIKIFKGDRGKVEVHVGVDVKYNHAAIGPMHNCTDTASTELKRYTKVVVNITF